jgi:hypothetical protein
MVQGRNGNQDGADLEIASTNNDVARAGSKRQVSPATASLSGEIANSYTRRCSKRSLKTGKEAVLLITGGDPDVQSLLQQHRESDCGTVIQVLVQTSGFPQTKI